MKKATALYAGMTLGVALALGACGEKTATSAADHQAAAPVDNASQISAILAGDHRTEEERARDIYRHPVETLMFFGLEPGMTVVEVSPGGGWYSQVIAPYLKTGGGKFYAAGFPSEGASERALAALASYRETYVNHPEIYGDVEMTALGEGHHIAPPGSADAVLTFRNVHNWQMNGSAQANFNEFFNALKPGGVLGVVEHRADGSTSPDNGTSGYVYTDDVKALAAAAGFEFDSSSEVNANEADTKNHPFGVWTLPPVRRSSAVRGQDDPSFDRAKYDMIGESDRMTLKFRKPLAADGALLE
ncbi:class I SAM-dependent methyltransferase [Hyphococcus sp.]|uniref:class I SAM-dependent methyltransferase n=1 Tax=Hyphococcus sp. TaxID=2038636 RepID=UPI00208C3EB8|nr:MAG: methyltransferase [Marinicaulis sp.]